ncbi:MAG: hypothetical protein EBR02_01310 [Alphaproteobacteria bacterium]|nr:hypothetical protein [Alphaproteobacteria bacterium]
MVSKNEDVKYQHEQLIEENKAHLQDTVKNVIAVKDVEGKEGKVRWLGMEMDSKFKPVISAVTSKFIPWINKVGAPTVGKLFEAGAHALRLNPAVAKNADTVGRLSFLWSTVFFQQISDLTSFSSEFAKKRNALFKEFKPVVEATGAQTAINEVMSTEYSRASAKWSASIKDMTADLATLVPNVMLALQQQNEWLGKKPLDFGKMFKKNGASNSESGVKIDPVKAEIERRLSVLPEEYRDDDYTKQIAREVAEEFSGSKARKQGDVNSDNIMDHALTLGAIASPALKSIISTKVDDSPTAWEMIKTLRHEVEGICTRKGSDCEFTPPEPDSIHIEGKSLAEYVVDIVQQNEKNRGRSEIAGVNLERLQESSQLIAEALAKGVIDADSLVVLVGEHKIVKRGKNGETSIADEDELKDCIEKMSAKTGHAIDLTADEFFKAFTNKEAIQQNIKKDIESLQGVEKSCFMALLPDEVLKQAGIKEEEIRAARVQARDHMYGIVEKYMQGLSSVVEESSPEELRNLGLTKKSVAHLEKLLSAMDGDEKDHALQSVVEGHHKEILSLIATVMLNEQKENPDAFKREWTEFVKATPKQHKKATADIGTNKEDAKEVAAEDKSEAAHDDAEPEEKGFASKAAKHKPKRDGSVLAMSMGAGL